MGRTEFGVIAQVLFDFVFLYPFVMSFVWMAGALFFWFHYERRYSNRKRPPRLSAYPRVALIVPCFNEEHDVRETVLNLLAHDYPNFEVIAVNDGSTDRTGAILDELLNDHPNLRVLHQAKNQGKAMGLHMAALVATAEFLLCIDGDALLAPDAARWMVPHFLRSPRLGAVTGNPRIRNRSTLLGRIQVGEFSSIIGLIKRCQSTYGRIFSVSGVCAMFRRSAVAQVGYWSKDMLTEDIDITWNLQVHAWDIRFEPAALCWIRMPETFKGLWKQRLRWAMGGAQAILKYVGMWKHWRTRGMWVIYGEYSISVLWSYAFLTTACLWGAGALGLPVPPELWVPTLLPEWTGSLIAGACLTQAALSLWLDRRHDERLLGNFVWTIWYPLAFWCVGMLTTAWALPKTLLRRRGRRAIWASPDRGVR